MSFEFHEYDETKEIDEKQENENLIQNLPGFEPQKEDPLSNKEQHPLEPTTNPEFKLEYNEIPNRIWVPHTDGTTISSIEQLHHHIDTEYPGLKRNPAYTKCLQDAEHHLTLFHEVKEHTPLPRGTITELARKHNYPFTQIHEYVSRGTRPNLYRLIADALSKTEAQIRLEQLHHENTTLRSLDDVQQRLHTYYPHQLLKTSPNYSKWIHFTEKYYAALDLLKEGGTFADVARIIEMDERHVKRWYTGDYTPKLIQLARHIPQEQPKPGYQWLTTKLKAGHGFKPKEFIQVPEHVSSWKQIRQVTSQLEKLDSPQMHKWYKQFGSITKEHAFAYILGMLLSDASKPKNSLSSAGFMLGLSRSYSWSKQVGDAACYYLGHLGIEAKRTTDWENSRKWFSGHSPIIPWIMQGCFKIVGNETTTYNHIKADYFFNASKGVRITFLHGVTDGDGIVSCKWEQLGIASVSNQHFLKQFLGSLDIDSAIDKDRIRIQRDCFERATNLPFFRHATGRQKNAEKLVEMTKAQIETRYKQVPKIIEKEICALRREGKSYGEIAEIIYDRHSLSFNHNKILRLVKKIQH